MQRAYETRTRKYLRDGRAPIPESEVTSRVMSAIKGRGTGLEMTLRKALWRVGIKGYRVNMKGLPGRPDIVFNKRHLAIFVHGCFWHRCKICNISTPKTHKVFWSKKFERNILHDAKVLDDLKTLGWRTMVIWECEVRDDLDEVVRRIGKALEG
jgi:DNA mismatch endonuclease (patch repair protein)